MDLENTNQEINNGEEPKSIKYNVGLSLLDGNNIETINQHLKNLKQEPYIPKFDDFVKESGLDRAAAKDYYDKVVGPEYVKLRNQNFNPWTYNKQFYPQSLLAESIGLETFNTKTARNVPISQMDMLVGSEHFSGDENPFGKQSTIVDDIADNAGYAKMKDGRRIPVSMISQYENLKGSLFQAVKTNDEREYEWVEMDAATDPAGKIVRSVDGIRTAIGQLDDNRSIWDQIKYSGAAQGLKSAIAWTAESIAQFQEDKYDMYNIPALENSEANKRAKKQMLETVDALRLSANRNFNYAKSFNVAALDEQGLDTWRGAAYSLAATIPQQIPIIASAFLTRGASATGLIRGAMLEAFAKTSMNAGMATMSMMAAGTSMNQFMDWGMSREEAFNYGGIMGLIEFATEKTIPANIMYSAGIKNYSDDVMRSANEYIMEAMKVGGYATIKEVPTETKKQAIKYAFEKVRNVGISDWLVRLSEKNAFTKMMAGGIEEGIEEGLLTNLYTLPVEFIYEQANKKLAKETENRYRGVQWIEDEDGYYRIERDGKTVKLDEDSWVAEQRDYSKSISLNSGQSPFSSGESWIKEGLLGAVSAILTTAPMALTQSFVNKTKDNHIASIVSNIASGNITLDEAKQSIMSMQLSKNFIDNNGKPITTPRSKVDEDKLSEERTGIMQKYQEQLNQPLSQEERDSLIEQQKKELSDWQVRYDENQSTVSMDELAKAQLIEQVELQLNLLDKYKDLNPTLLTAIGGNTDLLRETISNYKKLESINNAFSEIETDNTIKTEVPNINGMNGITKSTTKEQLMEMKNIVMKKLTDLSVPEDNSSKYSKRYKQIYNNHKLLDLSINEHIDDKALNSMKKKINTSSGKRLETNDEVLERIKTNESLQRKYNEKKIKYRNQLNSGKLTQDDFFSIISKTGKYSDPMQLFNSITNILFAKTEQSFFGKALKELNQQLQKENNIKEQRFNSLPGKISNVIEQLNQSIGNIGKITESRKNKQLFDSSIAPDNAKLASNINEIVDIINEGFGEISSLQESLSKLNDVKNSYIKAIQDSAKISEEVKKEVESDPENMLMIDENADFFKDVFSSEAFDSINEVNSEMERMGFEEITMDKLTPAHETYLRGKAIDLFFQQNFDNEKGFVDYFKSLMREDNPTDILSRKNNLNILYNQLKDVMMYAKMNKNIFQDTYTEEEKKEFSPLKNKPHANISKENLDRMNSIFSTIENTYNEVSEYLNNAGISKEILQSVSKVTDLDFTLNMYLFIKQKISEYGKDFEDLSGYVKIDEFVTKIEALLNGYKDGMSFDEIIQTLNTSTSTEEVNKLSTLIDGLDVYNKEIKNRISDLNSKNALDKIISEITSKKDYMYYYDVYSYGKAFDEKNKGIYSAHNFNTNEKSEKAKDFQIVSFLYSFKDCGINGRKSVKELYKVIQTVQEQRQKENSGNMISSYHQEMVLLQALINYDRGEVDPLKNPLLDKEYIDRKNNSDYNTDPFKRSFLVDGFPGSGKTTVFFQDYVSAISILNREKTKTENKLRVLVVSPTKALLRTYTETNLPLTQGYLDNEKYKEVTLDEFMSGNIDTSQYDLVVFDEFSAISQKDLFGLPNDKKSISKKLKSFDGQVLFLGDNGQVAYEQYHSTNGGEYQMKTFSENVPLSRFIAAYFSGERAIVPLQDSYRYGNVQNKQLVDFIRDIAGTSFDTIYENKPLVTRWGFSPLGNSSEKRKEKGGIGKKIGIRISDTSDVDKSGSNEVISDFINTFKEFKEFEEDTSTDNIILIVKDVASKRLIEKKINDDNTLSNIEKEELKSLIKTAVRDDLELSSFVSGLSSNNVFVYVDVKDMDVNFKYDETLDTKMFYSRLLMAPFSRVRTNGYMHVYMGEINPKTYVKSSPEVNLENLPTYKESTLSQDDISKMRDAYIRKLNLFTETNESSRKQKEDKKDSAVLDINNRERSLAITEEQQYILAELTKDVKEKLIKDSNLELTVLSKNKESLSSLLNKMLFIYHTLGNTLTENQFNTLKANIDFVGELYGEYLSDDNKLKEKIERVRNRAYTGGDIDYANAILKPTIIPYVSVNVNGANKIVDMIDVVGMKDGKPIVDVYFVSSRKIDKDIQTSNDNDNAKTAFELASKNNFIINQIKVISVNNDYSKILITESRVLSEATMLQAQINTNAPIATVDDLYSSFLSTDNKKISPIRTESIVSESRFYEPKSVDGTSFKLVEIQYTKTGDEKLKTFVLQNADGLKVLKTEEEFSNLPSYGTEKYELFNENAIIFEQNGLQNSSSLAIPISIIVDGKQNPLPIYNYAKSKSRAVNISNPIIDLKLSIIGLITSGTKAFSKYVAEAEVYDGNKNDWTTQRNIVYTYLDESFFNTLSADNKNIILSKIRKIVDEAGIKDYNENDYYKFLNDNYLNVISNSFRPETGYNNQELDDKLIHEQSSEINIKVNGSISDDVKRIFPFDNTSIKDDYQEHNMILNANRFNNIIQLRNSKSPKEVVIGRKRMGALRSKDNFVSSANDIDLILQNIEGEFGLKFKFDKIIYNQRMKNSGKIYHDVILSPVNNDFEPIKVRMFSKKADVSYINNMIKSLESFKDIEKLKLVSFTFGANESESKTERFNLYRELENTEAFQFILNNQVNLLADDKFKKGLSFLLLQGNTIHLKKNTPYNKYQQALEILKSMKNNVSKNDAYYNMAVLNNSDYSNLTTVDGPKGKRYVTVGMPQIFIGNTFVESKKTSEPSQSIQNKKAPINRAKKQGNNNDFFVDFSIIGNDSFTDFNFSHSAEEVHKIIESIIGSRNIKKLNLDLNNNFFGDEYTLGRLSVVANVLNGTKYTLSLKNKDGKYDESVARHEAAHFVSILLLSPKQRIALEKEVKDILIKNEKEPSIKNIYEYIADSYMNKFEVKKSIKNMSVLSRFIALLKQFVNKFLNINLTLSEFNYIMERGGFKNKEIYDIDDEFSFDKKIDNKYTSAKADDNLKKNLFNESNIQRFTQQIIPYIYKRASNYGSVIYASENVLTSSDIINEIRNKLINRSNAIDSEATVNYLGEKLKIKNVTNEIFSELSPEDRTNVVYYNLRNEDVIETLIQQTFYDVDVESVFMGIGTASDNAMDNFNEQERSNPDNMISSIYKTMLSTIPLVTTKSLKEDWFKPYDESSYRFVFYDYIDTVLKQAVLRLKKSNIEISRESFFNEIKKMADDYSESELKNAALSLWVEFGDYNGAIDPSNNEEDLIYKDNHTQYARGIGYILNNADKVLSEISTEEIEVDGQIDYVVNKALLDKNKEILESKVEKMNDLMSRMIVSAKSVTETVVSFVDMSNPSNIIVKEFSGSDITSNYTKLTDAIKDNLYEENRLQDSVVDALVGNKPKFKFRPGIITLLDENGNEMDNLNISILRENKKVPISENLNMYASVTKEILSFLGIENIPETAVFNLLNKQGYKFGSLVYHMLLSTYLAANVQKAYDNFLTTNSEMIELGKQKVIIDEQFTLEEDGTIDFLNANNDELFDKSIEVSNKIENATLEFMRKYRESYSEEMKTLIENNYKERDKHKSMPQILPSEKLQNDMFEVNMPSPLDFTKKLREFAINMTSFEYNSKSGKIKDPSGNSRYKYSRTTPLDELLYSGNMGQAEQPLSARVDILLNEKIGDSEPLKSMKNNLFYTGELDYDLLYSFMGVETRYKGASVDDLSVKDFMKLWIDDLFGKDVKRLKSNATLPIFLDNFADKTRVPYASFFGKNFKSPLNLFVEKGKIHKMEFRNDLIIKSINQSVDMLIERRNKVISEYEKLGIKINGNKLNIPDNKINEIRRSDKLSKDIDYIFKNGKMTFGPSVTFDQKESIFTKDFIEKWNEKRNGSEEELISIFEESMMPEIEAFAQLLSDSGYMFSEDLFEKVELMDTSIYNSLLKEYLPLYNEKYKNDDSKKKYDIDYFTQENLSKEEFKKRRKERNNLRTQMKLDFPEYKNKLSKAWESNDKKKGGFRELMEKGYKYESKRIDENGNEIIVESIYPPVKALAIGFFIVNNQLQQLYKGDEYHYNNVTNFVKRAAGDVSPIDRFDTSAPMGLEKTVKFIHCEDIGGYHSFIGKDVYDSELHTNGYSIHFPWHRIQMKKSAGGELGAIGDGIVKTTLKEYSLNTDKVTYLKFSQDHINYDKYEYDGFLRHALDSVLRQAGNVNILSEVKENGEKVYESVNLERAFNQLILQYGWEKGNEEFNKLLFETGEDGKTINSQLPGFIVFSSGFKTGQRGLNTINKVTNKNGVEENFINTDNGLAYVEVSTRNYGLQIIKNKPTESQQKPPATQNLRMSGLSNDIAGKDGLTNASKVNNILSDYLVQFEKSLTDSNIIDKNNPDFNENVAKFLKDLAKKFSNGKEASIKINTLLKDSNLSIDILRSKHIQNLLVNLNSFLNPSTSGNTYVQAPTQMIFSYNEFEGFYRYAKPGTDSDFANRKLKPTTYGFLEKVDKKDNEGNVIGTKVKFKSITKSQYDYIANNKRKPIEELTEEEKNNLGIGKQNIDDITVDEEKIKAIEANEKSDATWNMISKAKLSDIVVRPADVVIEFPRKKHFGISDDMQLEDVVMSVNPNGEKNFSMYDKFYDRISYFKRKNFVSNITENKTKESLFSRFNSKLHPEFDRRIEKLKKKNPELSEYELAVDVITAYYHDFNESLYVFMDRIPHSGFNSGQLGRIVAFAKGVGNTIITSAEKSILDGSDYDIDEMHCFFENITEDYITDSNKITNSLFSTIKDTYLSWENIPLFAMQIDLSSLRKAAEEIADKNKYLANGINTRLVKMKQGYAGKNLVGHFVNIQNAISVMYTAKTLMPEDIFKKFVSEDFRLLYDKSYIMKFLDLNQAFINAATDNSKEDGILGKLNITDGNTSMLAGMMLQLTDDITKLTSAEEYNMLDFVKKYLGSEILKIANRYYENNNSVTTGGSKTEYRKAIEHAYNEILDNNPKRDIPLNQKELDELKSDKDFMLKSIAMGEALKSFYDFDLLNKIKPNEFVLNNTITNFERTLGMDVDMFLKSFETIKNKGISAEERNDYNKNNFDKYDESYGKEVFKYINVPGLIANNNLFLNYIKSLSLSRDIISAFTVNRLKLNEKFLDMQSQKHILYEDTFNTLSSEMDKILVGSYLDLLGPVNFENAKGESFTFDMSIPGHRKLLVSKAPEIIELLKKEYPENLFVKRIGINNQFGDFPVIEIKDSKYYSPAWKNELSFEFKRMKEEHKQLIRLSSLIVYGFSNVNGAITEFTDSELEKDFTSKKDSVYSKIENNSDSLVRDIAITNYSLQNLYKNLEKDLIRNSETNQQMMKIEPSNKQKFGSVVTTRQNNGKSENNVFYIDNANNVIPVQAIYPQRINTYSANKIMNKTYPVLRRVSHTKQSLIYSLKDGETLSIPKPSSVFYMKQSDKMKFSRITKTSTVVLENGVIASIEGGEHSIMITKKGMFNYEKSILNSDGLKTNNLKPNMYDLRKQRIASRFAEHIVSRLQNMFPNINMQIVTNQTALERNVSGYVYNGLLYINEDMLTPDTPLHEIGHIITEVLKHSNRALYEQLKNEAMLEIERNETLRNWINNRYSTLSKEDKLLEAISLMIGFNTEDRISNFYDSIGSSNPNKKSFIKRANDAIRSFINSVAYIFFGKVKLGKIDNIENITISGLSEILIDAYLNNKEVSSVNSLVLRDMMMLNDSNIRKNVSDAKTLSALIPILHESDNLTKQLGQMDENSLVGTIYSEAIANGGVVRIGNTYDLSGIDLKGRTREEAWKEYIRKNIIKDLSYTHDIYVDNVLNWLNQKGGSTSDETLVEVFGLDPTLDIDNSIYRKFLYAINFDNTKTYVRYSDLKNNKDFSHLYDERLLGFNPIIAIEKIKGKKIISIYDITPTMYDPDKINSGKQNILGAYINNIEAHMYGVDMKNSISELRQLYIQLLANHISKVSDVAIDNTSVIKFNRGEVLSYLLDNITIKKTIEGIRSVKKFFDLLPVELQEVFSNPVKTVDVPYYEFLKSWYETHEIDIYQTKMLGVMTANDFNKSEMKDMILSRIKFLSSGKFGFLSNEKMNEMHLLVNTYKELYGLKVNNTQLNPDSISRDMSRLAKGTMNIGDELFMFVRDVITDASNEVVNRIIDVKDELHGNSKSKGIISILQDNYASIDTGYTAQSFLAHNEHKVYEKMYAYINAKDENGNNVKLITNNILWSLNEDDYIKAGYDPKIAQDFANQAKQNLSGNNIVLEQAEKITNFVEKILINRVKHDYYMKHSKRINDEDAKKRLYKNSNYKKGMVPVMNKKSSEEFYRGLNWKKSIESSAQEFVQEMTTFDYNYKQTRNELGIITEINDMFLSNQFGYSDREKPNDISEIKSSLGLLTYTHNLLGIGKRIDSNGNEVFYPSDIEKNQSLSMNLQTSLLYFALNGIRKEVHEEKSLPIVNGVMTLINELSQYKDAQITGDGDSVKKLVKMYSDMVVFGKQTNNDKLTVTEKVYNTTNRILTPMAMLGNLSVPLVSATTNAVNAFLNGLGSSFFETGEPTLADLTKASAIVMSEFGRVSEWAYRYQLINSSELESITHRWKGVVGEKYILNQFLSNFPNWGTDFYARSVSMVAHMLMDGSWDAHKYDKDTGKVFYDSSLDKRFEGEKGLVLKKFFEEQLQNEGGMQNGEMKRGYFFKSAKAMKVYADRKIVGAYSTDVKNILGMFFLGKMFNKFSAWMFTAIDNMFGKGQWVTDGGRVVVKQSETGEYYAEWERMFIEGWVRSYFELAKEIYKYRDINAFNKLNNVQKANIVKGGAILAITTALALLTRLGMSDDDMKDMKKDKPFLALMYKTMVNSLNSTLLFTELYRKAQNPFALIGMSIDNFDNLYKAFFNSKNEPEFNYNRLQKVVRVLEATDYVGLTNEE